MLMMVFTQQIAKTVMARRSLDLTVPSGIPKSVQSPSALTSKNEIRRRRIWSPTTLSALSALDLEIERWLGRSPAEESSI